MAIIGVGFEWIVATAPKVIQTDIESTGEYLVHWFLVCCPRNRLLNILFIYLIKIKYMFISVVVVEAK